MPAAYPPDLTHQADVPGIYDENTREQVVPVARIRQPGTVNSVEYVPSANLTGAATSYRTFTLYNRGSAGTGTGVVAQLAFNSAAITMSANVPKTITLGTATTLAVGDQLEWASDVTGSGMLDPGGKVIVQQSLGS